VHTHFYLKTSIKAIKDKSQKTADIFSTVTAGSLGVIPGQTTSHKEKLCGQPFAGWLPSSHPNQ